MPTGGPGRICCVPLSALLPRPLNLQRHYTALR
jgi:hypothetical protein